MSLDKDAAQKHGMTDYYDYPKGLKARIKELEDWKTEWAETFTMIMAEKCPEDEVHCGCVPFLRVRVKELETKKREIENEYILANSILESIEEILEGKKVSDFALSFPVVRQVADLKQALEG